MPIFTKKYSTPGTSPGEALHARGIETNAQINVMDFNDRELTEKLDIDVDAGKHYLDTDNVTWLHIQGNPSPEVLLALGETYGLHKLALEDVIRGGQRTKVEAFDGQYFVILNLPVRGDGRVESQQASFFLGDRYLISIYQGPDDIWEPVRQRLRVEPARSIRTAGADYLLYALLDTAIDHTFPILEALGDEIEETEKSIFENPDPESLDSVHTLRHDLIFLRRMIWPQRDMLNTLIRDDDDLVQDKTKTYLRDCYDHTIQIIDLVESYRDIISSMHDLYLSSMSNRMNEVMKVLTIIATIFIPLSFVAGLYGMNFDSSVSPWNMPELAMYYGYPILWLVMLGIAGVMLAFFRRRKWI